MWNDLPNPVVHSAPSHLSVVQGTPPCKEITLYLSFPLSVFHTVHSNRHLYLQLPSNCRAHASAHAFPAMHHVCCQMAHVLDHVTMSPENGQYRLLLSHDANKREFQFPIRAPQAIHSLLRTMKNVPLGEGNVFWEAFSHLQSFLIQ